MPAKKAPPAPSLDVELDEAMAWLRKHSSKATRDGMARFAIPSDHALGVTMSSLKVLAKQIGKHHTLAAALWKTGVYEARMLASLIDDPAQVTPAQMERWCRDFDNWGITDTVCFALFDRTPHAWAKVAEWHDREAEWEKRAAFALLWGMTVHDKTAPDARFVEGLAFIEHGAADERHFVKKAVNMALRSIGKRKKSLHASALKLSEKLAKSDNPATRWIGKDAVRELKSVSVLSRLEKSRTRSAK